MHFTITEYPNVIPKKPAGPRDMPGVLRGVTVPATAAAAAAATVEGTAAGVKMKEPPRQQYL